MRVQGRTLTRCDLPWLVWFWFGNILPFIHYREPDNFGLHGLLLVVTREANLLVDKHVTFNCKAAQLMENLMKG